MARAKNYEISEEKFIAAIANLEEGGTKKRSCEILGVGNNKTMERLISEFLERKELDRKMRSKKRKEPILPNEVVDWITDYLQGSTFSELSDRYYRSAGVIKTRIERAGALLRVTTKIDPLKPPLLPEACMSEEFTVGQIVWSAKYGCAVEVMGEYKGAYRIRVANPSVQESAYQAPYELGSLKHLEDLGVDLSVLIRYYEKDCMVTLNKTIRDMNRKNKERK